jgi:membrane protease YdiL (CAAX protease family)
LAVLVVIFALSLTVILHSTLFGLWHIGPLFLGAPRWAVLAVLIVPFLAGIGWGWQVRNDRTVLRAMVQHTLIWVVAGQFSMPQRDDRGPRLHALSMVSADATGMGVIIRDRGDDPSNFQTGG